MIAIVSLLVVSALLVIIINSYSITVVIYCKRLHKASHLAILSLLLGHLFQGAIVLPAYAYERSDIQKSNASCDAFRFSYLLMNYICCLNVLIISMDRFVSAQFPFKYKTRFTCNLMSRIITSMWLYVFLICLIPFLPSQDGRGNCNYRPQNEWVLLMLFGHTMIPFFIIIFCSVVIFKKNVSILRRRDPITSVCSLQEHEPTAGTQRVLSVQEQIKTNNLTLIVVGAFLLCRGPSFVYYLLLTICKTQCFDKQFYKTFSNNYDESLVKETIGFVVKYITLVDAFLSPVIYCTRNRSFASHRRQLFSHFKRKLFGEEKMVRYRKTGVVSIKTDQWMDIMMR